MPRNSFVQMNKLTNVSGRITYISSKAKQENLYATYTTIPERSFWRELAKLIRNVSGKKEPRESVLRRGS